MSGEAPSTAAAGKPEAAKPEAHKAGHAGPALPPPPGAPALHRVCIQCNNMFRVSPEDFDAKQCPACHKG
ncbi:MAG TPA: hypothetical protein VEH49_05805 [Methylomirabilota bacterium]|nr:hypothetical protein [Methylomirabilota bacterium]